MNSDYVNHAIKCAYVCVCIRTTYVCSCHWVVLRRTKSGRATGTIRVCVNIVMFHDCLDFICKFEHQWQQQQQPNGFMPRDVIGKCPGVVAVRDAYVLSYVVLVEMGRSHEEYVIF